jgi:hypothetical protein
MLFAIPGAEPLEPGDEPVSLQVWLGRLDGELVGVLADPPVTMPGTPATEQSARLHHIGGIQSVLIDDRLQPVSGLDPRVVVDTVFPEVENVRFESVTITVDGQSVPAAKVTYRGLDFAFASNYRELPVVLVKEAGIGIWPQVSTMADSS